MLSDSQHQALKALLAEWDAYIKRGGNMEGYLIKTAYHANQVRAIIAPDDKPVYPEFPDMR